MTSRITKTVALAALMAGSAGIANATEGWYGRADVGYSFEGESEFTELGSSVSLDHDSDWSQFLGLGYAFENGFRLEGELGHRFNQYAEGDLNDAGFVDGDVHAWSAMANLFYDFNRGGSIEPYVGVGIGAARLNSYVTDGADSIDDSDTVLAYQGLLGVAIGLTERLDLDVGYRYFQADDADLTSSIPTQVDQDYTDQSITLGIRYQFAVPTPPPPVAVCPTSEFVVYFEWDRSNLNQAALETIDAAVNRARECNISGITVVGHTDTSGSTAYNQGLSERRASVVRDALVARGIAAGAISAQARGESDLARATRDGVREPLNRRTAVTITFR
jgi:outer membrane protein OmpA-like peptidoglycan-associated protein